MARNNILPSAKLLHILVLSGIVVILVVYAFFDPRLHLFPVCPFHHLTGWDCPGCGSQRALHALLNAHFYQAWRFNPLLILMMPLLALYVLVELRPFPRLSRFLYHPWLLRGLLVAIILFWIGRNLL